MSRGPGRVELKITEALATAKPGTTFTVSQLAEKVFGGTPTTAQRSSVLRAAHAALRRSQALTDRRQVLWLEAWNATAVQLGFAPAIFDRTFTRALEMHPAFIARAGMPEGRLEGWEAARQKGGGLLLFRRGQPASGRSTAP